MGPAGDVKKGAKLFKSKCAQCHTANEGGLTKQGPNLYGILGRPAGSKEGFPYSEGNKTSGITWSSKHMMAYLIAPQKYIVGTKMVFAGIKKEKERAYLVAYLETLTEFWTLSSGNAGDELILTSCEVRFSTSCTAIQRKCFASCEV